MATYENNNTEAEGPIYQNINEPDESNTTISGQNEVSANGDMEFYEDNWKQPNSSVPHQMIGGVEYAVANVKTQAVEFKHDSKNDEEYE